MGIPTQAEVGTIVYLLFPLVLSEGEDSAQCGLVLNPSGFALHLCREELTQNRSDDRV